MSNLGAAGSHARQLAGLKLLPTSEERRDTVNESSKELRGPPFRKRQMDPN